jgi:hypothetical protein
MWPEDRHDWLKRVALVHCSDQLTSALVNSVDGKQVLFAGLA